MADPFESPKILIARAHQRTRDLESLTKRFVDQKPYVFSGDIEADGMLAHKIKITQNVPNEARADAFEIGNALRSALDQAVFAGTVTISGGHPKSTKFPFGDTIEDVDNDIKRGCRDVPAELVTLLRAFNPYERGDKALWALNKMRNTKTHQILLPVAGTARMAALEINELTLSGSGGGQFGMNRWDAEKQELTYMRTAREVHGQFKVIATIDVVLGNVPGLGGEPAVPVFRHLCGKVESIVSGIEAETARILRTRRP